MTGFSGFTSQVRAFAGRRAELSALDAACCIYLALPVALFFIFFAAPAIAVVGLGALALTVARVRVAWPKWGIPGLRDISLALAAAALCMLVGVFPPFDLGRDWIKHYAIFNLLIDHEWPVVYGNGQEFLRYYLGLYLPPALMTKILGRWATDICMLVWLWGGVYLCLKVLTDGFSGWRAALLPAIFFAFGGADVVGNLVLRPNFRLGEHLEWWAEFASLTSHSVLLAWVPQHALPGWLVAAMLMRRGDWTLSLMGPILVAACFWSPFVALGLVPFFILRTFENGRLALGITIENLVVAPVVGIPIVAFLTHGTSEIIAGPIWATSSDFSLARLLTFYALEFLILAGLLAAIGTRRPSWLLASVVVLIAFPLYKIGGGNDFAMRATVPALAVLAILAAETVIATPLSRSVAVVILLMVGTVSPISDLVGRSSVSYRPSVKQIHFEQFMAQYQGKLRNQYLAPYPHWTLR